MTTSVHHLISSIAKQWADYTLAVLAQQEKSITDDLRKHLGSKLSLEEINGVVSAMTVSFERSKDRIKELATSDDASVSGITQGLKEISMSSNEGSNGDSSGSSDSDEALDDDADVRIVAEYTKEELNRLNVKDLKEKLRAKGLTVGGNKPTLIKRLLANQK